MLPAESTVRRARRIVVVSDFCDGSEEAVPAGSVDACTSAWLSGARGIPPASYDVAAGEPPPVLGGYLERLPLASLRFGLCDRAEIWTFWARPEPVPLPTDQAPHLMRRTFRADHPVAPFASADMLGHILAFGAPDILCVWGLGVDESVLSACSDSIKIYNSIDVPALRVPPSISRHFDLVLTGAPWQSQEVAQRHPDVLTAVLPIGPEFASPDTFFPIEIEKVYDVIYVAAAQAYKRHDILFDALSRLPPSLRALCVCGYGELGPALRERAAALAIAVDFVGPPGVGFEEVNRLMNMARIGVVCGIDDGAPAVLTEYMLAGLPVLANAELRCGRQFITPATGRLALATEFHHVLMEMIDNPSVFNPRRAVLDHWSWQRSGEVFAELVEQARIRKRCFPPVQLSQTTAVHFEPSTK